MPGYAEWMLSFPRAPRGSVSIQVWGLACATVVSMVGSAVVALGLLVGGEWKRGKSKVKVRAGDGGGGGGEREKKKKKEL